MTQEQETKGTKPQEPTPDTPQAGTTWPQNGGPTIADRIDQFFILSKEASDHKSKAKEAREKAEKLGHEIMEQLKGDGLMQGKDTKGRLVYITKPKLYASYRADKKDDAIKMMKEQWGLADLFEETISPATLSRVLKERTEKGEPVPEEYFNIFLKETLGYRR